DTRPLVQAKAERAAAEHFMDLAQQEIHACYNGLYNNADESMRRAADDALAWMETIPNSRYVMPEKSPNAARTGRPLRQRGIKQFPGVNDEATEVLSDPVNEAEANRTVDRHGGVHQPDAANFADGHRPRDEVGVGSSS